MHRIFREQNNEEILKLQFSQRKHYDSAELYNNISWIMAIAMVILNIMNQFFSGLGYIPLWVNFVLPFVVLGIDKISSRNVKIGAATKEYIDSKLFNFEDKKIYGDYSKEKIKEIASKMKMKYPNEYKVQINNTGKDNPRGLKDWYTNQTNDKDAEVILNCQKENIWWNGALSKRFLLLIVALTVILITNNLIVLLLIEPSREEILKTILSCSSLFIKVLLDIVQAFKYYTFYTSAKSKIELCESKDNLRTENLLLLQKDINKIRSIKFLVPNFIHNLCSKKLHLVREEMKT